jgi:septal ring factor EnvC (AmiA/AmiB activator)
MDPQQITLWGTLGGTLIAALAGGLALYFKRLDPDVQAKAEEALWARVKQQLDAAKAREEHLERRIAALEEARESDRKAHEAQRQDYEKRISHLEEQIKDRDKQILALTKQIQAQGRRKTGGLSG